MVPKPPASKISRLAGSSLDNRHNKRKAYSTTLLFSLVSMATSVAVPDPKRICSKNASSRSETGWVC